MFIFYLLQAKTLIEQAKSVAPSSNDHALPLADFAQLLVVASIAKCFDGTDERLNPQSTPQDKKDAYVCYL
jgi:hypothetical protein